MSNRLQARDVDSMDGEGLRAACNDILSSEGVPKAALAREAGVGESTFSAWLSGKYAGDNERVASDIRRFLIARGSQQAARAKIPASPGFLPTETARKVQETLSFAQLMPDICIVAGAPGIGKTTAAEDYADRTPNCWVVTMEPGTSSPSKMLALICDDLDLGEVPLGHRSKAIARFLKGRNALLIIDEAQHLTTEAFEQLRVFHDKHKVGLALMGNSGLHTRLGMDNRKTELAQLFSRIGLRFNRSKPYMADVSAVVQAWGLKGKEELRLLKAIAMKPGALRSVDKVMRLATMVASGGNEEVSVEHIRSAWDRLAQTGVGDTA